MKTVVDLVNKLAAYFTKQAMIAPVEADATSASQNYAEGKQLVIEKVLYKAIKPITAGDALEVGVNIAAADDITDQISNEAAARSLMGAKNLLPNTASSASSQGVDYTPNDDGTITVNGTTTTDPSTYNYAVNQPVPDFWKGKNLAFSFFGENIQTGYATLFVYDSSNTTLLSVSVNPSNFRSRSAIIPSNADHYTIQAGLTAGYTYDGTFWPMLKDAADANTDYQPYSMTNQQLTPYTQAQSNRNLLDNPWFTINQRGQNSYSGVGYSVDRWLSGHARVSVTVNSDKTITLSASENGYAFIQNRYKKEDLYDFIKGKTVSYSVMLADGTIYSKTDVIPTDISTEKSACKISDLDDVTGLYLKTNGEIWVQIGFYFNGTSKSFKAAKLELGSVSTIAMDTAPNYAEELAKCQRYFQRLSSDVANGWIGLGMAYTASNVNVLIPIAPMRAKPTLSFSQAVSDFILNRQGGSTGAKTITAINPFNYGEGKHTLQLTVDISDNDMTLGDCYSLKLPQANAYIDLSADI